MLNGARRDALARGTHERRSAGDAVPVNASWERCHGTSHNKCPSWLSCHADRSRCLVTSHGRLWE